MCRLLADPAECRDRAAKAAAAVEDSAGILDRTLALLEPCLAGLPGAADAAPPSGRDGA